MSVSAGDTAWLLVATALVMVMLPGLALFYGGLVRRKNVLSTIMHSFFGLALVSVVWVALGFSLAFGPDVNGAGPASAGSTSSASSTSASSPTRPTRRRSRSSSSRTFQLMFAAITPALISGAFAERKRFGAFVLFTLLWSLFIYSPIAHWVWAPGGWLRGLGALDFAGGTVVHISSGVSALVAAVLDRAASRQRRSDGAARRADDRPWGGPAVVRLVRLQCRLGAGRERHWRRMRCW